MPAEAHVSPGAEAAGRTESPERPWVTPMMRVLRFASILGLLTLNLRFIILEVGWATRWEIIAFGLATAVILTATLSRPVLGPLVALPLVMVFGILHPLGIFFSSQALLFPFAAATLIWFAVRLAKSPALLWEINPQGWLADCFGLALIVKVVVSLASPSLVNGLWAATLMPQDIWMAEFQALNVGFLLANGLLAYQILVSEMKGRQGAFAALLVVEFVLVAGAALGQWLSGWPANDKGAITAPFFGVHDLGAFGAALFGIATSFTFSKSLPRNLRWAGVVTLVFVGLLLLASHSKSAWFASILILGFGIFYRFRFVGLATLLTGLATGFLLLRTVQGDIHGEKDTFSKRLENFLHPEQWHAQSSNQERLSLYQKAWALIKERPVDGIGLGDFRISETPGTGKIIGGMSRIEQNLHDAHNFILNFGSEMGIPSTLLFIAIIGASLMVCVRGIAREDADGWMLASLLAIFGFFFVNLFNCVIGWPYQALFMGQFLAMPFAARKFAVLDSAARKSHWGCAKWRVWAPLLPVLLIVAWAPFAIANDRRLQSRSAGNFHWLWWHEGEAFSVMPEVVFQVAREDNVRGIEVIPIKGRLPKKGAKIRVFVEGEEVYLGKLPKTRPLTIPISPKFENRFAEIRLLSPTPWEIWRMPSHLGLVETARIRLLGEGEPIDPKQLASER